MNNLEIQSLSEIQRLKEPWKYQQALVERGSAWENDRRVNEVVPGALIEVTAEVMAQGQIVEVGAGVMAQTFAIPEHINLITQELIPLLPGERSFLEKIREQYDVLFGHALGKYFCHTLPLGGRKIYIRQTPRLSYIRWSVADEQGLADDLRSKAKENQGLLEINLTLRDFWRLVNLRLLELQDKLRVQCLDPNKVLVIIPAPTPPLIDSAAVAKSFDGRVTTIPRYNARHIKLHIPRRQEDVIVKADGSSYSRESFSEGEKFR